MKLIFCSHTSCSHFFSKKCSNIDFCPPAKIQHVQLRRAPFCTCFTQEFLSVIVNALQNRNVGFLVLVPHHQVADDVPSKKNFPTYTNLRILEATISLSVETLPPGPLAFHKQEPKYKHSHTESIFENRCIHRLTC